MATPAPTRPRRWRRRLLRVVGGVAAAVGLYAVGFWLLAMIPVNTGWVPRSAGIEVFITTNGMHTEFVLPARNAVHDWGEDIRPEHFRAVPQWATHLAFGWGDRGFFLEARTLADVRVTTALLAASYLGASAMHVTWLAPSQIPSSGRSLLLDDGEYRTLVAFIRAGFARDAGGRTRPIEGHHYFDEDAFYEGVGRYGMFYTCNTWTNEGLRQLGVRTALWAVFAGGVMRHL